MLLFILADLVSNFLLELLDLLGLFLICLFERFDGRVHVVLALLSHKGFPHAISDRALVKGLISLDSHLDFVTNTDQKETSFGAVDGDLTDQLIEALRVEFFANRANAGLSCLALLKLLFELILEVHDVELGGWRREDVFDPKLTALCVLARRQDRVQVIFVSGGSTDFVERRKVRLLLTLKLLAGLGGGGDKDSRAVLDE